MDIVEHFSEKYVYLSEPWSSFSGFVVDSTAGGGAGGRVAIYYASPTDPNSLSPISLGPSWSGQLRAHGGYAPSHRSGAAGTVYYQEQRGSVLKHKLVVDNGGRKTQVVRFFKCLLQ